MLRMISRIAHALNRHYSSTSCAVLMLAVSVLLFRFVLMPTLNNIPNHVVFSQAQGLFLSLYAVLIMWFVLMLFFEFFLTFFWDINYSLLGEIKRELIYRPTNEHGVPFLFLLKKEAEGFVSLILSIIFGILYILYSITLRPIIFLAKLFCRRIAGVDAKYGGNA